MSVKKIKEESREEKKKKTGKKEKNVKKEARKSSKGKESKSKDRESKKTGKHDKLEKLKKRARELESSIEKGKIEKEKLKIKYKKRTETLLPLEEYVKAGIHLGTKVITPHMRQYVYRRRADGLAVLNTDLIDKKIKEATEFLSHFKPEDVILVCKREAGWNAAQLFSELTGIKTFTKKYPAGIITNTELPEFFEIELAIICDPWLDKNALNDVKKVNKNVLALCDTNNFVTGADVIIPCNNKGGKSIGLVLYVLAREYIKMRKIDKKMPAIEEFTGEKEE